MTPDLVENKDSYFDVLDPKFKGGDNSKCVVCGVDLGSGTFGKVCMKCHDEMIKRNM